MTHNRLPNSVRWALTVSAATKGLNYEATFGLAAEDSFPVE